ncbi:hypothetical protein BASA81_008785 [Batrachochytrium salamandrivorans]|nr:hypothetical protein BASA81_008785 [Batrachochytrium salamandrivorans]
MSGNSSRSAAVTPLYNSNGIVQYDPTSILRVMQCHYGSLAADTQVTRWTCNTGMIVTYSNLSLYTTIRNSDILDQDFSWNQIAQPFCKMSPRKATWRRWYNHCVLPSGTYTACQHPRRRSTNPICSCSVEVCGQVFASATIPVHGCAHPLFPSTRKMATLLTQATSRHCSHQCRPETRMQGAPNAHERFVETNNLLSYKQAGFRKREAECWTSSLACRYHSSADRMRAKHPCSIHRFRKAFDTAQLVHCYGSCRTWDSLVVLLLSQGIVHILSARARAGSLLSDPFPVQRGVRQGCHCPGLLFNLFINDSLDVSHHHSPWTTARHEPHPRTHVRRRCGSIC